MKKTPTETTPDVQPLFLEGGDKPVAYFCGKCRQTLVWSIGYEAPARCYNCDSKLCKAGHVVEPRGWCRPCTKRANELSDEAKLAAATVVEDYAGPVFYDNDYYSDGMEGVLDSFGPDDAPKRVFCSTEHRPGLDVDGLLQEIEENADVRDYEFDWTDVKELETFLAAWFEKQTIRWYHEDRSRCVELPQEAQA